MKVIAITGGTGFVGINLINSLIRQNEDYQIRVLSRRTEHKLFNNPSIKVISGDLFDLSSLDEFLMPGCTVINLAYSSVLLEDGNKKMAENLAKKCQELEVSQLIHCSTVSVYGFHFRSILDEETQCRPSSAYGMEKLQVEDIFRNVSINHFNFINLRASEIYGYSGKALQKLINDLSKNSRIVNGIKKCFLSRRKMNLVSIHYVVAAIIFLVKKPLTSGYENYVLAQDQESNNYSYIESKIVEFLGLKKSYEFKLKVPLWISSTLIFLAGRGLFNLNRQFSSKKINLVGFSYANKFEDDLDDYLTSLKSSLENIDSINL